MSPAEQLAYLDRIGIDQATVAAGPSIETLRVLHRAHLEHVPFENLDIHIGRRIELDEERIVGKIVHNRRGGFCYELNTAFTALLRSLGYEVTLLEARVFDDGVIGMAFDHLCLFVDLDRRYLVDVGFGDSFIEPIPFELDGDHRDPAGSFGIVSIGEPWFDLRRDGEAQYRFSTIRRVLEDFESGCNHHQNSQVSHFTHRPVVSRATPNGRVTLSGLRLIENVDGERSETTLSSEELSGVMTTVFGIDLPDVDSALVAAASGSGAALFDTVIGRCGVGWVEQRITVVTLPEVSNTATLARSRAAVGGSELSTPPTFVQRGIEAMARLLAGERRNLDDVLVDISGLPPFDASVYEIARTIPPGEVMTYGAVAKRLGQPGAAQAVGGAMGRNPVPLIVPCHRVIAADGLLGGFSANGGTVTKRRLLEIEGAPIDRSLF